ncbi:GlsB/YeaQ/YmgE family stress response membrane protein [Lichenicoccus sp.]|uniref:GlsB/YeaQ/YmgE family stress response membrane protein n=1 Tax=Lichenicoccus sp. TaxID=2781899 RepID=UPI003D0C9518
MVRNAIALQRRGILLCPLVTAAATIALLGLQPSSCWRVVKSRQRTVYLAGASPMSIIAWIILGLIAGFIGSKIVNKSGEGLILDIVLGVVGAIVGGFIFRLFGASGVSGINIYSLIVAVIGAIVVLFVYHAVVGRRTV